MLRASLLDSCLFDAVADSDRPLLVTRETFAIMKQPDITHVIPDLTAAFFRKRDIVFDETVDIGI